jgi:tripartite-type tricarboxylate transporter receptor subunit TctC
MPLRRRYVLQLAASAAALSALPRVARAQAYPTRPITMIVPLAAGGLTDAIGRVVAERMRRSLGQPIIIENITGADGSIGRQRQVRLRLLKTVAREVDRGPGALPGPD